MNYKLWQAWQKWQFEYEERKQTDNLLRRGLMRFMFTKLAAAFDTWREYTYLLKNRERESTEPFVSGFTHDAAYWQRVVDLELAFVNKRKVYRNNPSGAEIQRRISRTNARRAEVGRKVFAGFGRC